jgi:hypothetical protein
MLDGFASCGNRGGLRSALAAGISWDVVRRVHYCDCNQTAMVLLGKGSMKKKQREGAQIGMLVGVW